MSFLTCGRSFKALRQSKGYKGIYIIYCKDIVYNNIIEGFTTTMKKILLSLILFPACLMSYTSFDPYLYENVKIPRYVKYYIAVNKGQKLTAKQRAQIFNRMHEELTNGYKWLYIADEHASLINKYDVRQATKSAIQAAIASLASGDLRSKIVLVVLSIFADVSGALCDNYWKCQEALLRSKEHFEMAEFCAEILGRG